MLKIIVRETESSAVLKVYMHNIHTKIPLFRFEWPKMDLEDLNALKKGEDYEFQDDEGVFISLKDDNMNFKFHRGQDDDQIIEFNINRFYFIVNGTFDALIELYPRLWSQYFTSDETFRCDEEVPGEDEDGDEDE